METYPFWNMALSFNQAMFAIGFVAGVHPSRASALEARVKQWQKMGFPDGVNVGRGVRAKYGATQLCQLMLVLKLLTVGLTPERAIEVVRKGWRSFRDAFVEAASCIANRSDHLHYCLVKLDALTDLKDPAADHLHVYVGQATSEGIAEAFFEADEDWSDEDKKSHASYSLALKNQLAVSIVLEIDSLLVLLWLAVETAGGDLALFEEEFAAWYSERDAEGLQEQSSIEFFLNYHQTSIVQAAGEFDAIAAARKVLRKVSANGGDTKA